MSGESGMVTTVSEVTLRPGTESEWDRTMQERLDAVKALPGWVAGQVLRPVDDTSRRLVIGTWRSRADWERWHQDDSFRATRDRLDRLEEGGHDQLWAEVTVAAQR
jgi:heme-degrading monooxygenase HmoA